MTPDISSTKMSLVLPSMFVPVDQLASFRDLCTIVSAVIPAERSESRDPSFPAFWRRDGSRLSRFALGRDDNGDYAKVTLGESKHCASGGGMHHSITFGTRKK